MARNRAFLTDAGLARLRSSFVIVVGCGGVGSHAATALARSGVSRLRLIDFDQVSLSSLNRHAVATLADVGTPKVQCMRKRLEQIAPWVQFDCRNELFRGGETAERLLGPWVTSADDSDARYPQKQHRRSQQQQQQQQPSFVIDAIDNVDTKVALLAHCHAQGLPVVSSMGAGCKSDPTRLFIGDISASLEDPLARATRRRLRALGAERGIAVVYSSEKRDAGAGNGDGKKAQLLPLPEAERARGRVGELSVLPDFRVRIVPVLGTMPALFGYAAANHVIVRLAEYPHDEYMSAKGRDKLYEGILAVLQGCEERLAGFYAAAAAAAGEAASATAGGGGGGGDDDDMGDAGSETTGGSIGVKIPVTKEDVGFLVDEIFRGKSVVSGVPTRLTLIRWRRPSPPPSSSPAMPLPSASSILSSLVSRQTPGQVHSILPLSALVCMTKEEAAAHERIVLKGLGADDDGDEHGGRGGHGGHHAAAQPEDVYSSEVIQLVERRRKEIEEWERMREELVV